MSLRVTMLGSGTSLGVPVIGCRCAVCTSDKPYNRRLRVSLRLETPGGIFLVDTPPDLRQQALRAGIDHLDAILFTHAHADHVFGLDDVRAFNFRRRGPVPCYGSEETLAAIRRTFAYVFEPPGVGGSIPRLRLEAVREPFELLGQTILPVPVLHGKLEVFAYRLGAFAYVTDCSHIPAASFELLRGVEFLILGALRYDPHPTHFSVEQALATAERIGARRTVLTHLSHDVDPDAPRVSLPPGVEFGYDGLVLDIP